MTENEIKEYIADLRNKADVLRKSGFATNGVSNHFDKSADVIEELLSYRAIGTIEEFKALKDINRIADNLSKMERIEFKALKEKNEPKEMDRYYCPICRHYFEDGEAHNYCPECGQALEI